MAIAPAQFYAAPFDAIAERYDERFTCSKIGQAQRASVWRELEKAFRPRDCVLELGCGTGVDACFLADHGVRVVACDSSSQMIKVATRRVAEGEKSSLVETRLMAAEDIADLRGGEAFDGAFSNFGALNCVEDLPQLARNLAALLKPGSTAVLDGLVLLVGSHLVPGSRRPTQSFSALQAWRRNCSPGAGNVHSRALPFCTFACAHVFS
jgi:ubiquinone/menaquinone biosynthesis C-methylase UbiE